LSTQVIGFEKFKSRRPHVTRDNEHGRIFEFKQCVSISVLTGKKATNLTQLKELLSVASDESISHHTHQYFLSGHIFEYTNGFAQWTGQSLGEKSLSERLSNIDPYEYTGINDLRQALMDLISERLNESPEPRDAMPGEEFYFGEAITLIFPVGIRVRNLAEFLIGIKYIDSSSIYYHFYEARMRLGAGMDDFSEWFLNALGNTDLADKMKTVDPFMHTLEGIRAHIVGYVEEEVKRSMEELII
jgi:hypothetical protein